MNKKTKHDGDCSIFAAIDNGTPDCGVCTCGYGIQGMREDAGIEELYSSERISALHAIQDGTIDTASPTDWILELKIRHKPNLKKLIHWLYRFEYLKFQWENQHIDGGEYIFLTIEGSWSHNIKEIAEILGDFKEDT